LSTVENCDCLYFLEQGRIVDSGTYSQLGGDNTKFSPLQTFS